MKSKRHPDDEQLLTLCGIGDAGSVDDFPREHLRRGCTSCAAKVESYTRILQALKVSPLEAAPEAWIESTMARILEESAATGSESSQSFVQGVAERLRRIGDEIRMGLALDSRFGAAMPGIRSVGSMTPRQLLYESPAGSLHVQILESGEGKIDLLGQFLVEETGRTAPSQIHLEAGDKAWKAAFSPLGEFRFDGIPAGAMRLRIPLDDVRLVVDLLESE